MSESAVENGAIAHFGTAGAVTRRGVEIGDAGERGGASEVMLKGRLGAALHLLNPNLPHHTIEEVVRILSRPPHPTLIQGGTIEGEPGLSEAKMNATPAIWGCAKTQQE